MGEELHPGTVVQVTEGDEVRYGIYLGETEGYADIAFATGNVPLEQVVAVRPRP